MAPKRKATAAPAPPSSKKLKTAEAPDTSQSTWCKRCLYHLQAPDSLPFAVEQGCAPDPKTPKASRCLRCVAVGKSCDTVPRSCITAAQQVVANAITANAPGSKRDERIAAAVQQALALDRQVKAAAASVASALPSLAPDSTASRPRARPRTTAPAPTAPDISSQLQLIGHALRTLTEVTAQAHGIELPSWPEFAQAEVAPAPEYISDEDVPLVEGAPEDENGEQAGAPE